MCKVTFGTYMQTHVAVEFMNTMESKTTEAIN